MSATLTNPQFETAQHATAPAIRPFRVDVPPADLDDLRQRIAATRWPDMETVADQSQGVPLATMRDLARYWATDYDWRKGDRGTRATAIAHRIRFVCPTRHHQEGGLMSVT